MTPIHDQTYRRYQGPRQPPGRAWGVIASAGIRGMLGKRLFLALVVLAWLPFVVRSIQIYVVTMYPQAGQIAPVDATLFRDFLEQQGVFFFIIAIYAGAGLIANDRRANALQIYLSKPLMRIEYIGGKLAVLMTFLLLVTLLPAVLLIFVQIGFGGFGFLRANAFVVPAVVLTSLMRVTVASCTMLALSSLSKSTRYVAVLYTGIVFFSEAVYGVLRFVTGSSRVAWVSVTANLNQVSDVIFRQAPRYETPVLVSILVLAGLVALSLSVLERRVKGVEVVS
jgi:ABC-type transport system involved in multi-copper enzyme maturation permease subunit